VSNSGGGLLARVQQLENQLCCLHSVSSPTGDGVLINGQLVGTTLVLQTSTGGTVNIQLSGLEGSDIDFSNLSPTQNAALLDAVRGDLVEDAFGVDLGFLLPL